MEVLFLQVFVSFILVLGSVLLFMFSTRQRDAEHADRLSLLPMEDDDPTRATERKL
ncbi:MAG: cytochrome oxidase [Myxococcales bacterium]|nr:cytochrome oxidase [Myxococcales bacterium]